ncbi:MAG: GIY-YIG nuclease family protein [Deltaproteobacteria bacterium]|nr:GIY-YIG nuclease family protein [Deltaproteobacteria bacterium]
MPFWVYILECSDGSYYVGIASDLPARLARHQSGRGCAFTAARRPVRLVFAERHSTEPEAAGRERQLKGWSRAKKAALLAGKVAEVHRLSARRRR